MYIGTSIVLIAVGAILKFAVTATIAGVNIQTAGVILMVVGVIALVISLAYMAMWSDRRREAASSERRGPVGRGYPREGEYQ
jgi:NADH:ubiquinone oxidoreductase subunit H